MTKIYFVRHAEPQHGWKDDRTRPLTAEGETDRSVVTDFFKDKQIDKFYCSPYKRSIDTIKTTADFFKKEIVTDERFRERKVGYEKGSVLKKRWENFNFCEAGGETIGSVQKRNMEALREILADNPNKTLVIGTHGTALASILNFYDSNFGCDDFLRFMYWMPFIIELDFDGTELVNKTEHCYVQKKK